MTNVLKCTWHSFNCMLRCVHMHSLWHSHIIMCIPKYSACTTQPCLMPFFREIRSYYALTALVKQRVQLYKETHPYTYFFILNTQVLHCHTHITGATSYIFTAAFHFKLTLSFGKCIVILSDLFKLSIYLMVHCHCCGFFLHCTSKSSVSSQTMCPLT